MHITKWSSPNPLQDNTIGINGPFLDVVRSVEPSIYYVSTFLAFLDPIHPPYQHTSAFLCTHLEYHSAVSPLENTNWIIVILQLSKVIDLICLLKKVKSVLITFGGQIKVKNQSSKSEILHLVWQITRKNPKKFSRDVAGAP